MRTFRPRAASAITAAALVALTCVSGAAALTTPAEAASSGAVINEVYGGGGNSGATLTNDFIELANAGSGAAALDGWSVQYISASPGATTTWQVTPLTGSLSGGGLYLIGEAAGTGLPPTQASGSINMSGTSGTVALVDNCRARSRSSTRWPAGTRSPPPRTCRSPRSTRPARVCAGPGRRQHRVDRDPARPFGPGLLRVDRGHAGRG